MLRLPSRRHWSAALRNTFIVPHNPVALLNSSLVSEMYVNWFLFRSVGYEKNLFKENSNFTWREVFSKGNALKRPLNPNCQCAKLTPDLHLHMQLILVSNRTPSLWKILLYLCFRIIDLWFRITCHAFRLKDMACISRV